MIKTTKYFIIGLFLLTAKFASGQTLVDTLSVYPNPLCNTGTIHFEIVNNDTVTLTVLNIWGQTVQTIFSNTLLPSGAYSINFFGDTLQPGIYFVNLHYGFNQAKTKKIIKTCDITATEPITENENVIFYPNPTQGTLTIPIEGEKQIIVTNLQGQILKSIKTDLKTISLDNLAIGNYIVSVFNSDNKLLKHQQIVLTK